MNAQGTLVTVTDCFNHHSQAKRGKKTGSIVGSIYHFATNFTKLTLGTFCV